MDRGASNKEAPSGLKHISQMIASLVMVMTKNSSSCSLRLSLRLGRLFTNPVNNQVDSMKHKEASFHVLKRRNPQTTWNEEKREMLKKQIWRHFISITHRPAWCAGTWSKPKPCMQSCQKLGDWPLVRVWLVWMLSMMTISRSITLYPNTFFGDGKLLRHCTCKYGMYVSYPRMYRVNPSTKTLSSLSELRRNSKKLL